MSALNPLKYLYTCQTIFLRKKQNINIYYSCQQTLKCNLSTYVLFTVVVISMLQLMDTTIIVLGRYMFTNIQSDSELWQNNLGRGCCAKIRNISYEHVSSIELFMYVITIVCNIFCT